MDAGAPSLTERQDKKEVDDMRFLARTRFGKRLLLLPCTEAFEVIPPERDEEEWFTEKGVGRGPTTTAKMLEQEEKEEIGGWNAESRISAGRPRCNAEGPRTGEDQMPGSRGKGAGQQEAGRGQVNHGQVIDMLTASLASLVWGLRIYKKYAYTVISSRGLIYPSLSM
jgi:hypothetical protein